MRSVCLNVLLLESCREVADMPRVEEGLGPRCKFNMQRRIYVELQNEYFAFAFLPIMANKLQSISLPYLPNTSLFSFPKKCTELSSPEIPRYTTAPTARMPNIDDNLHNSANMDIGDDSIDVAEFCQFCDTLLREIPQGTFPSNVYQKHRMYK